MRSLVAVFGMFAAAFAFPAFAQPDGPGPISAAALEQKARDACRGMVAIGSNAIMHEDMDGDGKADVLFNWSEVTCSSGSVSSKGAGFCGMHNCSIDIYLSSQYRPGGWPKPILNHMEIAPEIIPAGTYPILRTAYQGGSCSFAEVCERGWRWNGSKFVSQEIAAADRRSLGNAGTPLEVTRTNLVGNWVDAADGCATDLSLTLRADGSYGSYEEIGDWRLIGGRIAIVVRETFTMGDAGSNRRVTDPQPVILKVVSLSDSHLTVLRTNGQQVNFRRC